MDRYAVIHLKALEPEDDGGVAEVRIAVGGHVLVGTVGHSYVEDVRKGVQDTAFGKVLGDRLLALLADDEFVGEVRTRSALRKLHKGEY